MKKTNKLNLTKLLMCSLLSFILVAPIVITDGVALANENNTKKDVSAKNDLLEDKRQEAYAAFDNAAGVYINRFHIRDLVEAGRDAIQQSDTAERIEDVKADYLNRIKYAVYDEQEKDARQAIDRLPACITDDFDIAVLEPLVVDAKKCYDNYVFKYKLKDVVGRLNYAIDSLNRLKVVVANAKAQANDLINEYTSQVKHSTALESAIAEAKTNIDKATSRPKVADALAAGLVKIKEVLD